MVAMAAMEEEQMRGAMEEEDAMRKVMQQSKVDDTKVDIGEFLRERAAPSRARANPSYREWRESKSATFSKQLWLEGAEGTTRNGGGDFGSSEHPVIIRTSPSNHSISR